jgi:hypothetical protein
MYPILLAFMLMAPAEFPDVEENVIEEIEGEDGGEAIVAPDETEGLESGLPDDAEVIETPPLEIDAMPEDTK